MTQEQIVELVSNFDVAVCVGMVAALLYTEFKLVEDEIARVGRTAYVEKAKKTMAKRYTRWIPLVFLVELVGMVPIVNVLAALAYCLDVMGARSRLTEFLHPEE